MPTNLRQFRSELKTEVKVPEKAAIKLQTEFTLAFLLNVALETPILTGHLHSNWNASKSSPNETERTSGAANAAAFIAQGKAALAGLRFGEDTWVTNAAPYASHVNDLHPSKAGFNEAAGALTEAQFARPRE